MLENKTIVVTGAANGIGAAIAQRARSLGATVVGVDLVECKGSVDRFVAADLSRADAIKAAAQEIGPGIDGLANVAGLPPTAGRVAVLAVNFVGLRAFTEAMIGNLRDGAAIVNLASLAGAGWPNRVSAVKTFMEEATFDNIDALCEMHRIDDPGSYFFSKEALICWTMQNRWTWRERGIRMNCVSPGPVETRLLRDFLATLGKRAEEDMKVMDRPGRPADIAPVVAFLLSDASAWIRGSNIPTDGGMFAHIQANTHGLH